MKKAMIGLAALVASSCLKPLDERAMDIVTRGCNTISQSNSAFITNLDLPVDNEYLTHEQIARVDKVLQEKSDCYLSVYFNSVERYKIYVVQKKNSKFVPYSTEGQRYVKLYP